MKVGMPKDEYILGILKKCREALEAKKAEKISILDLRKVNSFLDYFVICNGNSRTHCRSLAKEIENTMSSLSFGMRSASDLSSDWIVLDFNEIIVHIFTEEVRAYYDLDHLWSDAERISE